MRITMCYYRINIENLQRGVDKMSIFKVKDLRRVIDSMEEDGIKYVDIEMYDRDEIEGELIGATLEFLGISDDNEEIDYGGIEETIS